MKRLVRKSVKSSIDNNITDNYHSSETQNNISDILEYLNQFNDVKLSTTSNGDLTLIADGIRYHIL